MLFSSPSRLFASTSGPGVSTLNLRRLDAEPQHFDVEGPGSDDDAWRPDAGVQSLGGDAPSISEPAEQWSSVARLSPSARAGASQGREFDPVKAS